MVISGKLVPRATIVRPTKPSDKTNDLAILIADLVISSAPIHKPMIDAKRISRSVNISCLLKQKKRVEGKKRRDVEQKLG